MRHSSVSIAVEAVKEIHSPPDRLIAVPVATHARAVGSQREPRGVAFRLYLLVCAALVAWGASVRDENYVSAGFGLGYALGIAGVACMSLLLLYSIRKRARPLGSWGLLRSWLGVHMMLGILGPVAILFHANFRLGSTNSSVALACMLVVAASGVIGRIIYPKIHHDAFYARVFALWHAFHLPLCVLLFGAAIVHVIAAHMY
jgi:hypothetical protein